MKKAARNAPCPCGSGNKFKKCCESKGKLRHVSAKPSEDPLQAKMKSISNKLFQNKLPERDKSDE